MPLGNKFLKLWNLNWRKTTLQAILGFHLYVKNAHLTHPVKDSSPCHVKDLGGSVLAVLLGKQGHLQLQGNMLREAGKGVPQPTYGSQSGNLTRRRVGWYLKSGWVGQILRLLLHVLVLHPLHVQLLFPSVIRVMLIYQVCQTKSEIGIRMIWGHIIHWHKIGVQPTVPKRRIQGRKTNCSQK